MEQCKTQLVVNFLITQFEDTFGSESVSDSWLEKETNIDKLKDFADYLLQWKPSIRGSGHFLSIPSVTDNIELVMEAVKDYTKLIPDFRPPLRIWILVNEKFKTYLAEWLEEHTTMEV